MPPPAIRPPAERIAGRGLVSLLALAHLLCLIVARGRDAWAPWAPYWAGSAFAVLGCLLVRDFVTRRRRDRLPDVPSAVAWGLAGALEVHALSGAVAASRVVPAVLFPATAYLVPPV